MRFRSLILAAALALAGTAPALAATSDPVVPCQINSAATIICPTLTSGGGYISSVYNNSLQPQTAYVKCYATPNGIPAGLPILSIPPMGPGMSFFLGPLAFTGILACVPQGAPYGVGWDIFVH
jgi:hypothetical protein